MKHFISILLAASLLGCSKELTPEPESISEGRGNKHVKAMQHKTQFGSFVRSYTYSDGLITRSDYMDNGYDVVYNRKEGKITLTSYYFMPDQIVYSFGKDGRLRNMKHLSDGLPIAEESYGYHGMMMNTITYLSGETNQILQVTKSDFLSPWLQRLITTYKLAGTPTEYHRDTSFIKQTGAFELTSFSSTMQKQFVFTFSANVKDPEYNIPYTPSFDKIKQCIATENINRGWAMYDKPKFLGRLLIKTVKYGSGDPYPTMWIEKMVTDEDGLPLSYDEWFTEKFPDGWSYSKAIPTTYAYTTIY